MNTARQLDYQPAGDYATTVTAELDWLVSATPGGAGVSAGAEVPPSSRCVMSAASPHCDFSLSSSLRRMRSFNIEHGGPKHGKMSLWPRRPVRTLRSAHSN